MKNKDWEKEILEEIKDKIARSYLNLMSFSRNELYDQLADEGFTDKQIQYGLSQVGY